jgi:transmembrane sensor
LVGVFPRADTARILRALEATLPVRARRVLPGWVRLEAA